MDPTTETMQEPEDLQVRVGSREEASWAKCLRQSEELLVTAKENVEINSAIVKLAKEKIKEEKEKFK